MKRVKIISKFNCQSFPLDDTAIEVEEEILEQIGITKCFDVKNNKVIDYDNTEDLRKEQATKRIAELKSLLKDTDYQAIKFAEGQLTEKEFKPIKEQRQKWRDEINALEQ